MGVGLNELFRRRVGENFPASDDDEVVGAKGHLTHQVAGNEDGSTFVSEFFEQFADPMDTFGIESVCRFVEDESWGITKQCGGDAETLLHAERETLDSAPCHVFQSGQSHNF